MGKEVCGRFRVDLSGFGALAPADFGSGASGIRSSGCGGVLAATGLAGSVVRAGEFIPGRTSIVSGSAAGDGIGGRERRRDFLGLMCVKERGDGEAGKSFVE